MLLFRLLARPATGAERELQAQPLRRHPARPLAPPAPKGRPTRPATHFMHGPSAVPARRDYAVASGRRRGAGGGDITVGVPPTAKRGRHPPAVRGAQAARGGRRPGESSRLPASFSTSPRQVVGIHPRALTAVRHGGSALRSDAGGA
jgi:hypothetical protein